MASRVNKKFALIVASVVLVVGVIGAVVMYSVMKKSGFDHVRAGDAAMAEGDYKAAKKSYSAAVNHDPYNSEWLQKWKSALIQDVPDNQVDYFAAYEQYLQILDQAMRNNPSDVDAKREFFEEAWNGTRSRRFQRRAYDALINRADDTLANFSGGPEADAVVKKYRGLARIGLVSRSIDLEEEELDQAFADLETALETDPGDAMSMSGLVSIHQARALEARERDLEPKANEHLDQAEKTIRDFVDAHPGNALGTLTLLQFQAARDTEVMLKDGLEGAALNDAREAIRDKYLPRLDDAASLFVTDDNALADIYRLERLDVIERVLDPGAERRRARGVTERMLERDPDDSRLRLYYANLLSDLGEFEGSLEQLEQIAGQAMPPISLDGVILTETKMDAAVMRCQVSMLKWASLEGKPGADEALAQARNERERLAELVPDDSYVLKLADARLALADGDDARAQNFIAEYNEKVANSDPDGLWIQGQIAMRRDQLGVAQEAFRSLLVIQPTNIRALSKLTEIYVRLERFPQAIETCTRILELNPANEEARNRLREVRVLAGQETSDDPVIAAMIDSHHLWAGRDGNAGDTDAAIERLTSAVSKHGDDPRLAHRIAVMLISKGETETALGWVDRGLETDPDYNELKVLKQRLSADDPVAAVLEQIDQQDMNEADRLVAKYRVLRSYGRNDEAKPLLAQAKEQHPDHPRVIEVTFLEAIEQERLEEAERLAGLASERNLDRTNGLSFRAELLRARGDIRGAADAMSEAVELHSADHTMWRRLGQFQAEAGRPDDSVSAFKRALDMRPNDVSTLLQYLQALNGMGRANEALALARSSETYGRGNARFFELWMNLESGSGNRGFAIDRREQVYRDTPDNIENAYTLAGLYIDERRFDEARGIIDGLRDKNDSINMVRLDAEWHAATDDLEGARLLFVEHILDLDDPGVEPYLVFGAFMIEKGDIQTGLTAIDEARAVQSPERMEADRALGQLFARRGMSEEAIPPLRRVVDAGADSPDNAFRMLLVEMLQRERRFEEADRELAAFDTDTRESNITLRLLEIQGKVNRREFDEALRLLDQAAADFPEDPIVFMTRARVLSQMPGRAADAIADLETVIELDPSSYQAHEFLASLHAAAGRRDDAIVEFRQALRLNPDQATLRDRLIFSLIEMEREEEANAVARDVVERRPNDPELLIQIARLFDSRGLPEYSSVYYEQAWEIEKYPALCQWYVGALVAQEPPRVRRARQIVAEFKDSVESDPGLLVTRARIASAEDNFAEAARDCSKAYGLLRAYPERTPAWYYSVREVFENDARRIETYLKLLENDTDRKEWPRLFHAQLTGEQEEGRAGAIEMLRTMLGTTDDEESLAKAEAFKSLGALLYAQGDKAEAATQWGRGLELFPDDWEMNNNLAYVLARDLGRAEEGLGHAQQAVNLNPRHPDAYDTLGATYRELGRPDQATEAFNAALRLLAPGAPKAAAIRIQLADVYIEQGDRPAAEAEIRALEQIISVNPDTSSYKPELDRLNQRIDSLP